MDDRASIHYRPPTSLLRELRERAEEERMSVNGLMTALLASAIGWSLRPADDMNNDAPAPVAEAGGVTQQEIADGQTPD